VTALLEAASLSVFYGKAQAVRDVDLRIAKGQIVTVIGPNGAGKSTLLLTLIGALPSRGHIGFQGASIATMPLEARVQAGLSLVPDSRALFGAMSVADDLRLGAFGRRRTPRAVLRADLQRVYELFPPLARTRRPTGEHAIGRRAADAGRWPCAARQSPAADAGRAVFGPAPRIVGEVMRTVLRLREGGVSVLLVEQNARAALHVADYGYVLENGRLVAEGEAAELRATSHVIEAYLGTGGG
jgi:branched-chain amino acid transport system ATP-binding protein